LAYSLRKALPSAGCDEVPSFDAVSEVARLLVAQPRQNKQPI
jgi:hypothetical protein